MLGKVTFGLFFLLLVWGNLVAGTKSGLGCPDWPLCHGRVVPPLGFETYMEYMHRVIAALATVSLAALAHYRFRSYTGWAKLVPVAAMALVAAEIVMGGLVVVLELPMSLTTFHFMAGLTVFMLVFVMMFFPGEKPGFVVYINRHAALFIGLGALVFAQAALGAYVRHSGSGLACPDFPACFGKFVPDVLNKNILAQLSHRVMGYLVFLTVLALYAGTMLGAGLARNRRTALWLVVLALVQILVGAAVVLTGLYFMATALHLAVALSMLTLIGVMWARAAEEREV